MNPVARALWNPIVAKEYRTRMRTWRSPFAITLYIVLLFGGIELDQVVYAFAVTGATALMLGLVGIAFSSFFRRTLAATVAAYGTAFVLLLGAFVYGYLFPIDVDPNALTAPSPPVITLISPVLPLYTIATNGPLAGYGG